METHIVRQPARSPWTRHATDASRIRSRGAWRGLLCTTAVGLACCVGPSEGVTPSRPRLTSVSTRPDYVTGGDVLVRVSVPRATPRESWSVRLDGQEQAVVFRAEPQSGPAGVDGVDTLLGLVTTLSDGPHRLELWLGSSLADTLELTSHPRSGPVFSGPHQSPFLCQTRENLMGEPRDASCSAPTRVSYVYRTTEPPEAGEPDVEAARRRLRDPAQLPPGFKPLDPDAPRPADVARLTLRSGAAVDYIVRRERGTLNRAVYEIAFLHSPGEPLPEPGVGTPGWNGRLVYVFGGGCAAGYRQGILAGALHEELLQQGYAVAASSLNVFGNTCDDVISAETAMMVKEHFIEAFGPPLHTIGSGGSGGAMQQ